MLSWCPSWICNNVCTCVCYQQQVTLIMLTLGQWSLIFCFSSSPACSVYTCSKILFLASFIMWSTDTLISVLLRSAYIVDRSKWNQNIIYLLEPIIILGWISLNCHIYVKLEKILVGTPRTFFRPAERPPILFVLLILYNVTKYIKLPTRIAYWTRNSILSVIGLAY